MRLHRLAIARVEAALKASNLPPLTWYDALLELERVGETGMRPFELEAEMLLAQHNLSRLIDRLEAAKFVERHNCLDDKRGQLVVITSSGKEVRQKMWPHYAQIIQNVVGETISVDETRTLDNTLGKLIDRIA